MAQLVVSAAGAAIGGAIGGPAGARIGWMIGSIAGAALFAEKQEGPKIEDGKFSSSIYGQPIPLNYGTMRHATQLAWWSGLIVRTEEVGGKGGGGAEVEKARMNLLLAVCEGPQAAVLRIWANGRLIATFNGFTYDVDEEVLPAGEVRVYLGTDTQTADPIYEAAVGTENAVPYRGTVMVAIDGLEGAEFGNRPPNIEVEVAQDVTVVAGGLQCSVIATSGESVTGGYGYEYLLTAGDTAAAPLLWSGDFGGSFSSEGLVDTAGTATYPGPSGYSEGPDLGSVYGWAWDGTHVWSFDGSNVYRSNPSVPYDKQTYARAVSALHVDRSGNLWAASGTSLLKLDPTNPAGAALETILVGAAPSFVAFDASGDAYTASGLDKVLRWHAIGGATTTYALGTTYNIASLTFDPVRNSLWVWTGGSGAGELVEWSILSKSIVRTISAALAPGSTSNYAQPVYDPKTGYLWATGNNRVRVIDTESGDILVDEAIGSPILSNAGPPAVHPDGYVYVVGWENTYFEASVVRLSIASGSVSGNPVTLQSIVEDLCDRAGLPAGNLDASAGTDLVAGFKVARQTSARAAIDTLRPAYFFDMPEIGEQIVLTKRGAASVATIDAGELGAVIFQLTRSDPEPAYELEHVEEQEIPRRLELTYVDAGADYDPGVQVAERQVGESAAPLQIEVPVSLTAEQAARIAWANLMLAHASKSPMRLKLSHAYDALVPSNCINVPHASGNLLRVRVEQITRARPLLEVDGVLDEQSVYTFQIGGVPRYQGPRQSSIGVVGDTLGALLDVPPLRDQDDALVLYAGMARNTYDAAWSGASLYKSIDGGASYSALYSTAAGATIGATSGALADWTGGNQWDTTNTLTVVLTSGTFSSATDEAVLNGANAVAVKSGDDWEIVQFVTATLVGTNTWELTRLLRGRKGTERCQSGHASGDRVILLSAASLRTLDGQLAEIGAARNYKPVTAGQAVADAAAQALTLVGRSLMPLSPVGIVGTRDGGGDLTITWLRRSRIYADLPDLEAAPLDEPSESYEIDIYDGTSIVRTLTASSPTVTYTAAQQATDFGSAQSSVAIAVYQISSRVGRGHAGEATV